MRDVFSSYDVTSSFIDSSSWIKDAICSNDYDWTQDVYNDNA